MKKALMFLLIALLLTPASAQQAAAPENEGFQTQTVMVYLVGSDLESDGGMGTSDIREMLKAKPDKERMNVLVMTGGTNKWQGGAIPADRLSVYKIEGLNPKPVHSWEKGSMGEPASLTRFLDYAREYYPADSYGLVLWDHGGGPMVGFGMDTAYKGDGLTLPELRQAFEQSGFKGEGKLEWLAFDACLMASLEVASLFSQHAHYMIASQDTLPGYGFDYAFLKDLSNSGMTGPEAGRAIIDYTYAFYEDLAAKNPEFQMPVTLSLSDLGKLSAVQEQLDGLFANLDQGLEAGIYSDIARNRDKTKDYGRTTTTNAYDLIDLRDLTANMEGLYPERAGALMQAVDEMVIYNRSNAPRTNGVSLYFPLRNKDMFSLAWGELYQAFDVAPAYKRFMENFASILLTDSLSSWTGVDEPAVTLDEQTGEYFIQLTPEQVKNYERAEYYLLASLRGEEYMLTYMSGDVTLDADNRLRPNFNGKIIYVEDEQGNNRLVPQLMEKENIDGIAHYHIPMVLSASEVAEEDFSTTGQLLVQLDTQKGEVNLTGAIRSVEKDSLMGKQDVDLNQWGSVHLFHSGAYIARDEAGAILPFGDWSASGLPQVQTYRAKGGIKLSYAPLDETVYDYYVLMSIVDTQGYVYSSELMPLKAEPPKQPEPSLRPALTIDYAPGDQPQFLLEQEGVSVTLMGIEPTQEAPQALRVYLLLENSLAQEAGVSLSWASVNGYMMNIPGASTVAAGDSELMYFDLPIEPVFGSISLQEAGITLASDLRFGLTVDNNVASSLGWASLNLFGLTPELLRISDMMSNWSDMGEIRIATSIPVEAVEPLPPEEAMLLWEGEGIRIEQLGQAHLAGDTMSVALKITNNSQRYDMVQLEKSVVNGIMAVLEMPHRVQQGSILYTWAHINTRRMVLADELAEFQAMMDLVPSLEALGIEQLGEIRLRFALDHSERRGKVGRDGVRHLTDYVPLSVQGAEGFEQPLNQAGEEVFSDFGVRLVRLASDPTGKSFYVNNQGSTSIKLDTFGHVLVDGEGYGDSKPLYTELAPGASTYIKLYDYLFGIEPEGEVVSFFISIIDTDANRLLGRSAQRITLNLPQGE